MIMANNTKANNELTTTTLSSAEFAAVGMPLDISAQAIKFARESNAANGAACVNGDPLISVAVATIRSDLRAAETGTIRASIGLALLEEHDAWRGITAPDGKPFRNVQAFRRVVFSGYDESNVRKYSDAGRRVYLPALRGELSDIPLDIINVKDGQIVSALPMRTATVLKAGLSDAETRNALPAMINDVNGGKRGQLSFRQMSEAVKAAKDKSGQKSADSDTPVASAADVDSATIRAETKRVYQALRDSDELSIVVDKDNIKRMTALLALAAKTPDNAMIFVKEFIDVINNAR